MYIIQRKMANSTISTMDIWNHPIVFDIRTLFYAVSPNETSYETMDEVPHYVDKAVPYFIIMMVLEAIFNFVNGHKERIPRLDDAYSSITAGIFSVIPHMLVRNIELGAYIYIHTHFALFALDWNSPLTWWITMIGVDCGYYWLHRCAHEVNFLWAAHQVHHSSEDYNLSTALRQSILQKYTSWMFYLPLAFFIPPSIFLAHIHFNLVFQFWIHTEIIDTVGPLEWILNTPSHHRVHHGRNRYCIDKNYAGTFIIFDRIFGTFAKEEKKDEIAYGLVHSLESWDPIYTQFCHWRYILGKAWEIEGIGNKISVFLKGPGWDIGKPRLGYNTDIPDIKGPVKKYSALASVWLNIYLYIHFALVFVGKEVINSKLQNMPALTIVAVALYIVWGLTNIGHFYERKSYAPFSELVRCVIYLMIDAYLFSGVQSPVFATIARVIMGLSTALMVVICGKQIAGDKTKLD